MNTRLPPTPTACFQAAHFFAAAFILAGLVLFRAPAARAQLATADQGADAPGAIIGTINKPGQNVGGGSAGLTVTVIETGQTALTDSAGKFHLDDVKPGTYTLLVSGDGSSRLRIKGVTVEPLLTFDTGAHLMPVGSAPEQTETARNQVATMSRMVVNDVKETPFTSKNVDIPRGKDDVQPYYFFDAETIDASGSANIEDFLKNDLTMDTNARSDTQLYLHNNNNGDTSTFTLNGLPALQTLILVNGRRQPSVSTTGTEYQPDLNNIPTAAIDHIEVLPSSAAAIYGANALGGVINVILKKDYTGGQIRYTYDNTMNTDSPRQSTDLLYGFSLEGGKTHVTLTGHYATWKPLITQDRLEFVQRGVATVGTNYPAYFSASGPFQGASTNILNITATETNPATGVAYLGKPTLILQNGTNLGASLDFVPAGTTPSTSAAVLAAGLTANAGQQNLSLSSGYAAYGLKNQMGSAPQNKALTADIRREMTPWLEFFSTFTDTSQFTSSPDNLIGGGYIIEGNSPTNPFQNNLEVNIPANPFAPAAYDFSLNDVHTISSGFIAKLPGNWTAEMDYTWSQDNYSFVGSTYDTTLVNEALNDGLIDPFVDENVAPVNMAQFTAPVFYSGATSLNDLALRGSGPLFSFPWGPVALTVGLEHRKSGRESGYHRWTIYPLETTHNTEVVYLGQDDLTNSGYAEMEIPVINAKNALPGLREFSIQLAGREEFFTVRTNPTDYVVAPLDPALSSGFSSPNFHDTTKYNSANPTMGFLWKPVEDVIIRSSFATGFLPPTYGQLVPSALPTAPATLITDPKNNLVYDVSTISGGNAELKPQTSRNVDIGAIYEPHHGPLQGFRADLEYHEIWEHNVITAPTAAFLLNNAGNYADRITRDPATGLITFINITNLNLYSYRTSGYDLSLDYLKETGIGTFKLHVMGSIIEHLKEEISPTVPMLEYVGFVDNGGVLKTKANATLSWSRHRLTLGLTAHYYDQFKQNGSPTDPEYGGTYPVAGPTVAQAEYVRADLSNIIPAEMYYDFFGSYTFNARRGSSFLSRIGYDLLENTSVQFGIRDLLNTVPPFDSLNGATAYYFYAPFGDPRLRTYWFTVKRTF